MKDIVIKVLEFESRLVTEARARGELAFRPSSVLIGLVALFYILSPVDLIPEALTRPLAFGYIDDIIVAVFAGIFIYKDVRGLMNEQVQIRDGDIQESPEFNGEITVPGADRPRNDSKYGGPSDGSTDNDFIGDSNILSDFNINVPDDSTTNNSGSPKEVFDSEKFFDNDEDDDTYYTSGTKF